MSFNRIAYEFLIQPYHAALLLAIHFALFLDFLRHFHERKADKAPRVFSLPALFLCDLSIIILHLRNGRERQSRLYYKRHALSHTFIVGHDFCIPIWLKGLFFTTADRSEPERSEIGFNYRCRVSHSLYFLPLRLMAQRPFTDNPERRRSHEGPYGKILGYERI